MNALVSGLSRLVVRAPAAVVAAVVALTVVLAAFAAQVEMAVGNEGFAPDDIRVDAAQTLGERFGGAGEEVMQVVVRAEPGADLITADGLRAVDTVAAAITDAAAADRLATRPDQPPVVGPFGPVLFALEQQGLGLADVDDATVREAFVETYAALDEPDAGAVAALLPDDAALDVPSADAALLLVFLSTDGLPTDAVERFDALIELQDELAAAAEAADVAPGYEVSSFSFPLLFADTETVEAELARLFATAFVIIVLILATVFWLRPHAALRPIVAGRRTLADVLLTMATIVGAITWMNGGAALLGPDYLDIIGRLTEVTQIIPILLIGLGVDYAIHLTSRYREEVGEGASVADGIARAIRTVGLALALATVTTAVGFLTNVFNPVPTLRDFGLVAAVGIVAAFALMLTFVPAMRLLLDRRAEGAGRLPRPALARTSERILPEVMARTAVLAERGPVVTLVVTVALGGALGFWGLTQLETRFSSTDFVPPDNPVLSALDTIEERFAGGFGETTEVLITGDVATVEAHGSLVGALEDLGGIEWVATINDQPVAESPVSLLAALITPGPDGDPIARATAERAAAEGLGEDLRFPVGADVAAVYATMSDEVPAQAERVLDVDDGTVTHARVAIRTSAGEADAAALRDALDEAFAPLVATGVTVVATSNPIINATIVSALQDAQATSLSITLLAVLALLVVSFWVRSRRPALGVITTAPVLFAVLWTFAMMAATDIPFGPVTATIAALAIGIGIPYSIHVTNRFEEDRRRMPTTEAVRSTVRHTGGALAGSALTTCAGFGVLVTSSLTPFRQFGLVTVYAIGFALLAAMLVLPSALTLWDRWHRGRDELPAEPPTGAESPQPAHVSVALVMSDQGRDDDGNRS